MIQVLQALHSKKVKVVAAETAWEASSPEISSNAQTAREVSSPVSPVADATTETPSPPFPQVWRTIESVMSSSPVCTPVRKGGSKKTANVKARPPTPTKIILKLNTLNMM